MNHAQANMESLDRAVNSDSLVNIPAIMEGFSKKGINPADILPRVNVFTYGAWQAKGRQVKRGEHGIQCITWIISDGTDKDTGESYSRKFPKKTKVFHISQTDPVS